MAEAESVVLVPMLPEGELLGLLGAADKPGGFSDARRAAPVDLRRPGGHLPAQPADLRPASGARRRASSGWPRSWATWRRSRAARRLLELTVAARPARPRLRARRLPRAAPGRDAGAGRGRGGRRTPLPLATPRRCAGRCGSPRRSRPRAARPRPSWRCRCAPASTRSACSTVRARAARRLRRGGDEPALDARPASSRSRCGAPRARPPPSTWRGRWRRSTTSASRPRRCATCRRCSARPPRRRGG